MKRSPLRADPQKVRAWQNKSRQQPKPARRQDDELSREARRMRSRWAQDLGGCAVCAHERHVHGHHVLALEVLKREGVPDVFWFDDRNRLTLCHEPAVNRCHDRHTLWVVRVPRAVVMQAAPLAIRFASEVDLLHRFDHEYPEAS